MTLHLPQMPISFTGWALAKACESHYFVSGRLESACFLKALARLIYQIGVGVLLAPLGIMYHLLQALHYGLRTHSLRAWEHLKAVGYDLQGLFSAHGFFKSPFQETMNFFSGSKVIIGNIIPHDGAATFPEGVANPRQWAGHLCSFYFREYRFDYLFLHKTLLCQTEGQVTLNDARVLHAIIREALVGSYPSIQNPFYARRKFYPESIADPGLALAEGQANYRFPWKILLLVLFSLALIAFGAYGMYRSLRGAHRAWSVSDIPLACGIVFFSLIPRLYTDNRGKAEMEAALANGGSPYWQFKAAQRGYGPALRSWGLYQIAMVQTDHALRMGLKCLYAAAQNGSDQALEDLEELAGNTAPGQILTAFDFFKPEPVALAAGAMGRRPLTS